jgi:SAM-dependent methyltransferase
VSVAGETQTAPRAQASPARFGNGKTERLARLMAKLHGRPIRTLLVVGCGNGTEAAILQQELGARVVGIDLDPRFDPRAAAAVRLQRGDACRLEFADGQFDYVYSYHALEHIPEYRTALQEMRRVLAADGGYCIGTPNRARLLGYVGSSNTVLSKKIAWNAADWGARLRGRFRNEYGAHAGFTSAELSAELRRVFADAIDISDGYYDAVYGHHARKLALLRKAGVHHFIYPSVYFVGHR